MDPTDSTVTMNETTVAASKATKAMKVAELSSALQHFGILDYFVFVLMLSVCAIIGLYFGLIEKKKKQSYNEQRRGSEALDYLVGGRKMKVFPVALSLVARYCSNSCLQTHIFMTDANISNFFVGIARNSNYLCLHIIFL